MRNPRVSSPARELPLHLHPAVARWMAELRRQQRRGRPLPARRRPQPSST